MADYDPTRPLVIDPALAYASYLGGSGSDFGIAIAVDGAGNTYVAGGTYSTDFPTVKAVQASHGGGGADAFVAQAPATPGEFRRQS